MGDRFYEQQKNYKPVKRLKKDILVDVNQLLGTEVKGLNRCTNDTLDELIAAVERKLLQ